MTKETKQPPLIDEEGAETTNPATQKSETLIDPSHLRLSQNFAESVDVKKALLTVPVRKPGRQDFVRVHPDESYRLETAVLELKEDRETYLVDPAMWPELPGEIVPKVLFSTINRQGVLTLWPVRLPSADGRHDEWSRSALDAATMAQKRWIRVAANMGLGAYEVYEAVGNLPEPEWPDVDFPKILRLGFRGRYIDSMDHHVVRRLVGEM
ncbi:MAG: hypothetical protein OES26_17060 [Gammaproteobacteria bacterium]|nr:hypothetical protein [Gammaproteobacteria bacterium]